MKKICSLSDLFMEELAELLNIENQLDQALPDLLEASQSSALKIISENHLKVTKEQSMRLYEIFNNTGQIPQRILCEDIKILVNEAKDIVNQTEKGQARDIAIINVIQQIKKCEIHKCQIACEHAIELNHTGILELLNKSLNEERTINFYLNELAQYMINVQALNPLFN